MHEEISRLQFWQGIRVLLQQYHTLNKKLFACIIKEVRKVPITNISSLLQDYRNYTTCDESELFSSLTQLTANCEQQQLGFLVVFSFLNKKVSKDIEAIGVIDLSNNSYSCKFQCDIFDDFSIKWTNDSIEVKALTARLVQTRSAYWLESVLKPKLLRWCKDPISKNCGSENQSTRSLQLVDIEAYNDLYKQLKIKYSGIALQLWEAAKESTDPLKFIYEDLAIAAYLITLWKRHQVEPTAFADLGCGNGLLVFILNQAGYKGYGYDIRARKLWSLYPAETANVLIETAIEPTTFEFPADVNWLIGNHSDELSPWLPVLAAKASYGMHYFLLPCCAYEFSGAKFQRRNSGVSTYNDFLAYASNISTQCGFVTLLDRLKIPSTKRLALIGMARQYDDMHYESKLSYIDNIVLNERLVYRTTCQETIKLRNKTEAVRNCTQIDKRIIEAMICKIFQLLLQIPSTTTIDAASNWQCGGRLTMREIVKALSAEDLKHIKSECGGLKTLLRNKHEIFEFCGNDFIGIRRPIAAAEATATAAAKKPQTVKKRMCFFQLHHPNGCPLSEAECTFIH